MADDLIEEWKRAAASPAPAAAAPGAAEPAHVDDLISEWRRTLPPKLREAAGGPAAPAAPSPEDAYLSEARSDPAIRLARWAHGHGNRSITDLVTGRQPDSYGDVAARGVAGLLGRGAQITGGTLAQGLSYVGEPVAKWAGERGYIAPETARRAEGWHDRVNAMVSAYRRAWDEANPGVAGELGSIGGQIASTGPVLRAGGALASRLFAAAPGSAAVAAPVAQWAARNPYLAAIPKGAATGAAANVLTSSASDAPIGEQAALGAAGGAALGPIGHGLGRLFTGAVDRETADLAKLALDKYKIPIRVDQISANPMARFGGSVAQRTPGTGLAANVAEQQGAFNKAVANTFGENADKITPGVMAGAKTRIGNVFDTTLPKLEAYLNPKVSQRLADIDNALPYLPAEDARIISRLRNDIIGQFGKTAVAKALGSTKAPSSAPISGKQIQALITKGSPLDRAMEGGSSNVKYYAGQMKNLLLDAVGQTPTGRTKTASAYVQKLQEFSQARAQYKNMKTIEDLAEKATTGDISPALLMGQVRQSFGNMAYGGGGDLADLARIGQRFLKEPPSSGTAERLTLMNLGLGAAAGAGGIAAFDPEHFQRDLAILGAAALGARGGGGILKSGKLARAAVRSGHRTTPPALPAALTSKLPFFAPRHNPLTLPVPGPDQNR